MTYAILYFECDRCKQVKLITHEDDNGDLVCSSCFHGDSEMEQSGGTGE